MKLLVALLALTVAGCNRQPVEAPYMTPERQAAVARCHYVGGLHNNDGDGGIGAERACFNYFRETGEIPRP